MNIQKRASYKIRPTDFGTDTREQLLNVVRSFRDASSRYTSDFKQKLPELYDLWRGYTTGSHTPTKNNIWIPLIYSTIWSDVARKMATHFASWPIVGFFGYGEDDMPASRKVESLVNAQLMDADVISKELITFLGADLYGTSVSQLMWDHQEEVTSRTDIKSLPVDEGVVRLRKKRQIVTFDGPNYKPVDLLDFYPQPGFKDINGPQGMNRCAIRYYLDLDDCRYLASDEGMNVFSTSEVERMVAEDTVASPRIDESQQRRFDARQGVESVHYGSDLSSRPVEIVEMWGKVPHEFAKHFGGSTNVVITMANDRYLLRAVENPFDHRQKPFVQYSPTPDPHYFHAPGKAEIAHQMQVAGNRFINQQLDAADLLVHPMFAFNRQMGVNTRNLWAGPGRIFGVDGDPAQAIKPIQMDFRGLQAGGQMAGTMWEFIQMGTGVAEDTVMGMGAGGSDRQTAREFMGRREASGTRLMLESVLYDAKYLEPLGNFFQSMNHQFLELPRQVLVLGDSAVIDKVTGQRVNDTRVQIDGEVLNNQYAARAMGTTMHMSAETEKANMLQMFQVLASANDQVAGAFNMVNFFRDMLEKFGFKNVNELIKTESEMQQMTQPMGGPEGMPSDDQGLMQLMGGGAMGGPMSGVPGA